MAVSVRQSTWKMVGANTKRRFRNLQIQEKHTLRPDQSIHAEAPEAGGPIDIGNTGSSVLLGARHFFFFFDLESFGSAS